MVAQRAPISSISLCASFLALAACGPSAEPQASAVPGDGAAPAPVAAKLVPTPRLVDDRAAAAAGSPLRSCAMELGAAAGRRAAICRAVSPATHPPCNVANSCAAIDDEIARSCALLDGVGPPMAGCQPAPKSMAAAVAVVRRYYSALGARDYDTAWRQWGEDGPPSQTPARFSAGFAHTRSTRVTIGRLEPGDGAAGSIYQTVPVTVDATLDDGTRQRFRGSYILRRVNGVDGATPAQLRWHIDAAQLRAVAR